MAFDPDAFLAGPARAAPAPSGGGFDPDAFLALPAPEKPKKEIPKLHSAGMGAINTATFGFIDEAAGAIRALTDSKDIRDVPAAYRKARDEERAKFDEAREANPKSYFAGGVAGGVLTAPIALPVRGVGFAANAARGAAAGTVTGVGESKADSLTGIVEDAAKGGLVGGAVGGTLGAVAQRITRGAQGRVDQRTLNDIGYRSTPTTYKKIADFAPGVRDTARKYGLDEVARDPVALAERVKPAQQQVGRAIGESYEAADKVFMGVKARDVVQALKDVKSRFSSPGEGALRKQVDSLIGEVNQQWGKGARQRVPLADVNRMVGKLEAVGFASANLTPAAGTQLKRDVAGAVEKVLQKRMGEIQEFAGNVRSFPSLAGRPAFGEATDAAASLAQLKQLNGEYRALKLMGKAAAERGRLAPYSPSGIRQIAGETVDTGALLASLATGNPLPYLGAKVGIPLAKAGARAADTELAKLMAAAKAGSVTAKMLQSAIEAGVPRGIALQVAGASVRDD